MEHGYEGVRASSMTALPLTSYEFRRGQSGFIPALDSYSRY